MPAGDAHGQREPTGRVIASCSSVLGVEPQRAQRPTAGAWVAGPRRSVVLVLERSHALTLRPRLRSLRYGRQKPTARSAAGTQDGSAPETCGRRGGSTPEEAAEQIAACDLPVSSDGSAASGPRATVASSARRLCAPAMGATPWRDASFDHTSAGAGSRAAWGRVVSDTAVLSRAGQRGGRRTSPSSTPSVPHASCARCDGDRTAGCHVSPARCSRTAWASA